MHKQRGEIDKTTLAQLGIKFSNISERKCKDCQKCGTAWLFSNKDVFFGTHPQHSWSCPATFAQKPRKGLENLELVYCPM
jgi:hypothetical protein